MRNDRERLLDMREAIVRIEKYAARGRSAFELDELIQTWVLHHLEIIGEAARSITDEYRSAHPSLPWSAMIGTRNVLVHHYFGIDKDIVWSLVENDLPPLKAQLNAILEEES